MIFDSTRPIKSSDLSTLKGIYSVISHNKIVWNIDTKQWPIAIKKTPIRHCNGYDAYNQIYEFGRAGDGPKIIFPDYMIDNLAADYQKKNVFIWTELYNQPFIERTFYTG